jgi:hypothetical protein
MKLKLIVLFVFAAIQTGSAQDLTIYFQTDSFKITKENSAELDAFIQKNGASKNRYRFEIIGHTDDEGNLDYNQKLSLKRAITTKNYLVDKGFDTTDLILAGKAFVNPVSDNTTEHGKALNRRVSVVVSLWKDRMASLLPDSLRSNEFSFEASKGFKIQIDSCCSAEFLPFAFADESNQVIKGKIKIRISYLQSAYDAISSGTPMQTTINGMELAYKSHLMFKLEAFHQDLPILKTFQEQILFNCGCEEKLKNSELFLLDNANWSIVPKISVVNKATGSKDRAQVPPVIPQPAGKNNTISDNLSVDSCSCLNQLITDSKHLPPAFNIYPEALDSITGFTDRYQNFYFARLSQIDTSLVKANDPTYFPIKLSIKKKGKNYILKISPGNYNRFPELKILKKYSWKLKAADAPSEIVELKKKRFSDLRLNKTTKGYELELKEKSQFIHLAVKPDKKLEADFPVYQKSLSELEKRLSDSLATALSAKAERAYNRYLQFWKCYHLIMSKPEKGMSYPEWIHSAYGKIKNVASSLKALEEQKARLALQYCPGDSTAGGTFHKMPFAGNGFSYRPIGLGLFNVDEVLELKEPVYSVDYTIEGGIPVNVKQAYVYNKETGTIINAEDPTKLNLTINSTGNMIVVIDNHDNYYRMIKYVQVGNELRIRLKSCTNCFEEFK